MNLLNYQQLLKGMLNLLSPDSMPGQAAATTVATAVETQAHKYISGENIKTSHQDN